MRKYWMVGFGIALVSAVGLACTTKKAGGSQPVATGGTGGGVQASGQGAVAMPPDRPPHRFSLRPHEAHLPVAVAPLPNLSALPRFVDGAGRCYQRPPEPHYPPQYAGGTGSIGGYGYGYGGGGRTSGSLSSASGAAPAKKSRSAADAGGPAADAYAPAAPPAPAPKRDARSEGSTKPSPAATQAAPLQENKAPGAPPAEAKAAPSKDTDRSRSTSRGADDEKTAEAARRYEAEERLAAAPVPPPRGPDFGASIYLSNDDTMSLSSAQRVIWAIDRWAPIPSAHVRPHELLNYFSFETGGVAQDHDFNVLANIAPSAEDPNLFTLGLSVAGRPLGPSNRRNVNLAYVIDRSGSMNAEGRMDYLKRGLLRSLRELKHGDIVHIVLFDDSVCDLAQNFVVGRDSMPRLEQMISQVRPLGSTNLHDGLVQGYAAVDRTYQPGYSNRVLLITDALANTGVTDEALIATVAKQYDDRKVRLSGVGVGSDFNDSLLDSLTERGKGAYVFLGSQAEVDAVFGAHFVSLVETIANDVHFKLSLPPSLAMQTFYGEEASTVKERVQAIHYFAGTSQMFLSDLVSRDGRAPVQDDLLFTIEYEDPESGQKRVEEFAWNIGRIFGRAPNLDKAMLVSKFARELGSLASRTVPSGYAERAGGWGDSEAAYRCSTVQGELRSLGAPLQSDPEVVRVLGLWDKFCSRYVPPPPPPVEPYRPPVPPRPEPLPRRNNDYAPPDKWPGAQ